MRSPCCEMMGLKKGPWTPEEDHILISHIQRYGHGNWRALPKQAGLLRCGKSCRLRWINYLRPDIKRGSFSEEEVKTIIELHGILGNRWSAIAARLPGRTDNEIKNFWHTHLKKHERSKAIMTNTSSYSLQETQAATSNSGDLIINIPQSSRGAGFNSSTSSAHNEMGEEMEFWYNVFISSHHKGMEI